MADDKTRLLAQSEGNSKQEKQGDDSGPIHQDDRPHRPSQSYGTLDNSSTDQGELGASSAELAYIAPLPSNLQLHSTTTSEDSTLSLVFPSSFPVTSLASLSRNSPTHSQQNQTTGSAGGSHSRSLYSPTQTRSEDLPKIDSRTNQNGSSNNHSNASVAQQPTASTQAHYNGKTTQNPSSLNTKNEHQLNNPLENYQVNNSESKNDLANRSSFLPQNFKNKKNQLDKSTIDSSLSRNTKAKSISGRTKGERSHLLMLSDMEVGGYVNDAHGVGAVPDVDKSNGHEKTPFFVYYLACFATIGGLLFGYDTGIVSGAMLLIKDHFELSTMWQEAIVSGTVGAAAVFSLLAGFMCDFVGRKITIMIASVVFVAGAVIMGASGSVGVLLTGRIVVGVGVGFASMTVPVYVAEAAPSAIRGRLVTLNQLFITIGILISSLIAGAFSGMKSTGWRYMLGLAGIPGIIQFIGFIFLPESPRWLVMKGREEQATRVLQRIRGKEDVSDEMREIMDSVEEDKKQEGFVLGRVIRTQYVRRALFVGCGLQVFQQLCGINTVIYYSATILTMAGFPTEDAIWLVLVPNSINFLSTIIGVALVEKLGRKKLLVGSFLGVVVALVVLAVGFQLSANFSPLLKNVTETHLNGTQIVDGCFEKHYVKCEQCIEDNDCGFCFTGSGDQGSCLRVMKHNEETLSEYGRCQNQTLKSALGLRFSHGYCPTDYTWMAVLGLALFVMAFAPGLGPMPWTINSEIYPMWARSTCNSLATGANWICNLLVSLFFLTLTEAITKYGAFWLFGGICFFGMLFTIVFLPETKNKSLEEVEELFKGSKNSGKDNLGYERDVRPSVKGSNTKL